MLHRGSCHCGRIAFELEADIAEGTACNCSLCRRRGWLLAFVPRDALRLTTTDGAWTTYRFNKHHIDHHFCPTCGVAPFSDCTDPRSGAKIAAVNLRCLDDLDLDALPVRHFDGASL
jgi:hypothetical protein